MGEINGTPKKVYCVILHILHSIEKSTIAIHTDVWSERPGSTPEETVRWQVEGLIANFKLEHNVDSVVLSEEADRKPLVSGEIINTLRTNLNPPERSNRERTGVSLHSTE